MDDKRIIFEMARSDFKLPQEIVGQIDSLTDDGLGLVQEASKAHIIPQLFKARRQSRKLSLSKSLSDAYSLHLEKTACSLEALKRIKREFERRSLRFVLFKGLALSMAIYNDVFLRQSGDLDILVEKSDSIKADLILRELGFIQSGSMRKVHRPDSEASLELTEYSTPFPVSRHSYSTQYSPYYYPFGTPVKVELHWSIADLSREHVSYFFWNTIPTAIDDDLVVECPTDEASFLMMVINCFENSVTLFNNSPFAHLSLRDYCDVQFFFLAHRESGKLWDRVLRAIEECHLEKRTAVVLAEYASIYGEAKMTPPSLLHLEIEGHKLLPKFWSLDFKERYLYPEKRVAEWRKRTKQLVSRHANRDDCDPVAISEEEPLWTSYESINLPKTVQYALTVGDGSIYLHWSIPASLIRQCGNYIFQIQLIEDGETENHLTDLYDMFYDEEGWHCRHEMHDRVVNGASKSRSGEISDCQLTGENERYVITSELCGCRNLLVKNRSCRFYIIANVFKHHHGRYFHQINCCQDELLAGHEIVFLAHLEGGER